MKSDVGQSQKTQVAGVIVTYQPAHDELLRLVEVIRPQVDVLSIIDNGDGSALPEVIRHSDVKLVCLGDNYGIAHAQNMGIRDALNNGSQFVLLLDQDSIPKADMVTRLTGAYDQLVGQGMRVAAVGPSYIDQRQGDIAPFVYRDGLKLKRRVRDLNANVSETDFLIASGCLIPSQIFPEVGMMEEGLFIDYVDIEWGLRARHLGFRSFGVHDALMSHSLGDEWIKFGDRRVPVHSPLRHYYHFRNAIWLARRPWIGWPWRVILIQRLILQFAFFSVFAGNRREHIEKMSRGILHGLMNYSGKLKN